MGTAVYSPSPTFLAAAPGWFQAGIWSSVSRVAPSPGRLGCPFVSVLALPLWLLVPSQSPGTKLEATVLGLFLESV